jgi:diguanylate cyclase (GGDEF)-like protein
VAVVKDVTELHLLRECLSHQSLHDVLTGLPNQQFFISHLEGVLGHTERTSRITVCKIDLDGLAVINDGFGREIGDQLLQSVAQHLESVVAGEKAMVARFGSDESAILIENSPTMPNVAALAGRINTELAEPVYVEGYGLAVSAGVGFVEHQGGGEPAELLRAAEAALHSVKRGGKRQWRSFDTNRDAPHRIRCRLAAAMPGALEIGEITLGYQPLAQLTDGKVVAIEPLLRWDHPHSGTLRHHECLELAARTGLQVPLGQWLLHSVCEQFASWRQHFGDGTPLLHIDLTPQQSQDPDLVANVRCALEHAGLAAEDLQLGVPILALGGDTCEAEDNLRVLADAGAIIVLAGFSGIGDIAYLKDFPVRTVEIAHQVMHCVVQRLGSDSEVAKAVFALLELVHSCGATVMARGLETQEEANWWRSAGADLGQGTFCAPLGTHDEITVLLKFRRSDNTTKQTTQALRVNSHVLPAAKERYRVDANPR